MPHMENCFCVLRDADCNKTSRWNRQNDISTSSDKTCHSVSILYAVGKHSGLPWPPTVRCLLYFENKCIYCTEHSMSVTETTSKDVTEVMAAVRYRFITHNDITMTKVPAWLCHFQGCGQITDIEMHWCYSSNSFEIHIFWQHKLY